MMTGYAEQRAADTSQTDDEPAKLERPKCPKLCWLNKVPVEHPNYELVLDGLKRCSEGESILAFSRQLRGLLGDIAPGYDAAHNCVMKHWGRSSRIEAELEAKAEEELRTSQSDGSIRQSDYRAALIELGMRELYAGRLRVTTSNLITLLKLAARDERERRKEQDLVGLYRGALRQLVTIVGRVSTERTRQVIRDELRRLEHRKPRHVGEALEWTSHWNDIPPPLEDGIEAELIAARRREAALTRVLVHCASVATDPNDVRRRIRSEARRGRHLVFMPALARLVS